MEPSGHADVVRRWVDDRSRRRRGGGAAAGSAEGRRTWEGAGVGGVEVAVEGARTRAKVRATTRTWVSASASNASAANGAHGGDSV